MIRLESFCQGTVVFIKYRGRIDRSFMISFMEFLYSNVDRDVLEKALIDFRNAEMDFEIDTLREIADLRVNLYAEGFIKRLTSVYLVSEAKSTAYTTLYSRKLPEEHIRLEICSTMEYALRFLSLDMTVKEAEEKLSNLAVEFNR